MLNPRNYYADCIRLGFMEMWRVGMPWAVLAASINSDDFAYSPAGHAQVAFERATSHPWDILDEPPSVILLCGNCSQKVTHPWTTCTNIADWGTDHPGRGGLGYLDESFEALCNCGYVIDHNTLRVEKFRRDLLLLMKNDVPMPGTYLTIDGKKQMASRVVRF
jgi:hypothetical protein